MTVEALKAQLEEQTRLCKEQVPSLLIEHYRKLNLASTRLDSQKLSRTLFLPLN